MKSFMKLYSDFWRNHNNAELINLGMDAQFLAIYLQSNSHRSMLGVYFLPIQYIAIDIKEPCERIQVALQKLCAIGYCKYDEASQYIWVCDVALEQIGALSTEDNRLKPIHAVWQNLPPNLSFLEEVYQKYRDIFHLAPRNFIKANKVETKLRTEIIKEAVGSPEVVISPKQDQLEKVNDDYDEVGNATLLKGELASLSRGNCTPCEGVANTLSKEEPIPFTRENDTLTKGELVPLPRGDRTPSEGVANTLPKGGRVPFGSNIDNILEIKDDRCEIGDGRREKREEREYIQSKELTPTIVAQARPVEDEKPLSSENSASSPTELAVNNLPAVIPQVPSVLSAITSKNRNTVIAELFDYWKTLTGSHRAKLDPKRYKHFYRAMKLGYTAEQIRQAIAGCLKTPYNLGYNDTGRRYVDIGLILRDADHIDRFIYNFHNPPSPPSKAQQLLRSNAEAAEAFVNNSAIKNHGGNL